MFLVDGKGYTRAETMKALKIACKFDLTKCVFEDLLVSIGMFHIEYKHSLDF